ncbi:hypothetical protein [Granulicella mallensis]|uniref:Uncharacterized protein n=1 Tax=Granulicella mallensis (strain ATCC BAA-1857 / DSM 23137 / MP5ACTX8) TaxID=682795 RepID=G8NXR3_GRAMM|nr:hypothetical protein [Granulicella mallensis]AEU34408.1 hypothetical protein AciX8_0048 [Granulicella mallensis MP5ACTX8]
MRSLFLRLFSNNYWRRLFHRETWRSGRVALRRAHKDRRARKELRQFVLLLLPLFFFVAYLGFLGAGGAGVSVVVIAAVLMGLLLSYLTRTPEKKNNPQPLPSGPELRREFAELALLHAVLTERAGHEVFLQTKELPEGIEVTARHRHLQTLREHGLYNRLGDTERDLLLLPDGHWTIEQINTVWLSLEPLRLLRWVLRVDDFLPTVGDTMTADYRIAGETVKEPETVFRNDKLIGVDDLNMAISVAEQCFYRFWAEGVHRGLYAAETVEKAQEAKEYVRQLAGKESSDLLVGTKIVSLCSDSEVQLATNLALRRTQVLQWVSQRMSGEFGSSERMEGFYLR